MKIAIAFALSIASLAGASARAADLDITVADVRVAKGTLMIALVDSAAGWEGHPPTQTASQAP